MKLSEFEEWLVEITPELREGAFVADDWRAWLQQVFARLGPAPRHVVEEEARSWFRALMASPNSWPRIAKDLRTTTSRELVLTDISDAEGYSGWIAIKVTLDGEELGTFGHGQSPGLEEFVAHLADFLCEFALDEEIWGGWPTCPDHGTHPLHAEVAAGVASWCCPNGRTISPIGSLTSAYVPIARPPGRDLDRDS